MTTTQGQIMGIELLQIAMVLGGTLLAWVNGCLGGIDREPAVE
jgi:hypothetical protein